jgi:hypothetical protein
VAQILSLVLPRGAHDRGGTEYQLLTIDVGEQQRDWFRLSGHNYTMFMQ